MHKTNAYYQTAMLILAVLLLGGPVRQAAAWGPHSQITRAAIKVLPDLPHWKAALGSDNLAALADYCWMPDERGMDMKAHYADDYLLIHQMPRHVSHVMPDVKQTWVPYFRRALQALRTETPVNACRQIGSLIHFVEDTGAPPHAREQCPHHSELENWVRDDHVIIKGYRPRLLGATDAEAEAGLLRRMAGLVAFSKARAERALPLVSQPTPDRAKVEPIILESALESARVTADVLYTLFSLGLGPQPPGASWRERLRQRPCPCATITVRGSCCWAPIMPRWPPRPSRGPASRSGAGPTSCGIFRRATIACWPIAPRRKFRSRNRFISNRASKRGLTSCSRRRLRRET